MRIDSVNLPAAARQNSRVHSSSTPFPGIPSEKANEVATTKRPEAENIAAQANAAEKPEKSAVEKLTPEGLLNALKRFETMTAEEMNKGQTQALASINRNIARYQEIQTASISAVTPDNTATSSIGETVTA